MPQVLVVQIFVAFRMLEHDVGIGSVSVHLSATSGIETQLITAGLCGCHRWVAQELCFILRPTFMPYVPGARASNKTGVGWVKQHKKVGDFRPIDHYILETVEDRSPDSHYSSFYRAMLCIARTVLVQDVCLSVHPSVKRRK